MGCHFTIHMFCRSIYYKNVMYFYCCIGFHFAIHVLSLILLWKCSVDFFGEGSLFAYNWAPSSTTISDQGGPEYNSSYEFVPCSWKPHFSFDPKPCCRMSFNLIRKMSNSKKQITSIKSETISNQNFENQGAALHTWHRFSSSGKYI